MIESIDVEDGGFVVVEPIITVWLLVDNGDGEAAEVSMTPKQAKRIARVLKEAARLSKREIRAQGGVGV